MKNIPLAISIICLLAGCQSLPQFFTAAEQIATDTAIKAEVSREAIQKDTNVDLNIKIYNKEIQK